MQPKMSPLNCPYGMKLTTSEKLIFIISFMTMMNWGVRIFQNVFNQVLIF